MNNSFQNGIERIKASLMVIRANKSLIWYPIITVFSTLVVLAAGIWGIASVSALETRTAHIEMTAIIVAMVLVVTLIGIFTSAIFFCAATMALEGEKVSFRQACKKVFANKKALLQWWAFTSFVSIILMAISMVLDKLPGAGKGGGWILGRVLTSMANITWAFATYFAIPVLMTHPDTPINTLKHSAALFKKSWGESVTGTAGYGLLWFAVLTLGGLLVMGVNFLIYTINPDVPGVVFGIVYASLVGPALAVTAILTTAASTIFHASLYRYAETGDYVGPYTPKMLEGAFRKK